MTVESAEGRDRRRRQRTLFDRVADLYDASRRGYPKELVDFVLATAELGSGGAVLEVGCGTGQLTEQLARSNLSVTAIDIGPSMVAAARRRLGSSAVRFEVVAFEEFEANDASFDLIVSATAFHWIDPDVRFVQAARLLREGGWLSLLATGERYDDPFGAALLEMWIARSDGDGAWLKRHSDAESIAASGLFDTPIERMHAARLRITKESVVGIENTRATSLSWNEEARQRFTEELWDRLHSQQEVDLTQETSLTMARLLPRP